MFVGKDARLLFLWALMCVSAQIFGADCCIGFGHMLKIPVVGAVSSTDHVWVNHYMGIPLNLAVMPHQYYRDPKNFNHLNFWDRLSNAISAFQQIWEYSRKTEPQTGIARKWIDPNVPEVGDLRRNLALLLVNSHFSLSGAKPFGPSMVEVGGIHVEKNTDQLTPELKKWLDESTRGVVYFSLGSLIAIETIAETTLDAIFSSFAKIAPVRVLVKIANETRIDLNKLPKNVKFLPWIPQVPVLRHKNTRAFITHGGLMGTMEAMYHQVPMIGIPFFADQARNIHMFASKNVMFPLSFHDINETSFGDALGAVLQDPKYKDAAVKLSKTFRDRPLTAAATAVYWIEYVIRNGADSLKSPAVQLYWFQSMLLDVYTFLLFISTAIALLVIKISKVLIQSSKRKVKSD